MTEGMIGANPAQMRELAKSMSLSGQALDKVAVSLQCAVTQSRWHGPDSERFRQQWFSRLRPTLRTASVGLEDASKLLLTQAAEQEKASADTGNGGSLYPIAISGTPREAGMPPDVFTDPEYRPAPSGIDYLLEEFLGDKEAQSSALVNVLKWVADTFGWTVSLGELEEHAPKIFTVMKYGGWLLGGAGILVGALDIWSGIMNADPFRVADGAVGAVLALATAVLGPSSRAGIAVGIVSFVWGVASMISGDVPLTKRIWDLYAGPWEWALDLAETSGRETGEAIREAAGR